MIKKIDITDSYIANEVLSIQIPSYEVEAKLIDFINLPPLNDTVDSLQASGEVFFGYYLHNDLCGVISYKMNDKILDIHRLFVHPNHFRKGIANHLLYFIESHEKDVEAIIVSTGSKNYPAKNLYSNNGFIKLGEKKIDEALFITIYKKLLLNKKQSR